MVTDTVDPERYLRRLAEREMLESEPNRAYLSALDRVAAAFVAANVLERPVADAAVASCTKLAAEWGRRDVGSRWVTTAPHLDPMALTASRFVPGPLDADVPWGNVRLRWVRFAEDWTNMAVSGQDRIFRPRIGRGPPPRLPTLEVSDDRGTTTTCHFGGTRNNRGNFSGTFTAEVPLAADTAWLALHGQRVDLPTAAPAGRVVRVEPLPARPLGLSYLWHELGVWGARLCRPGRLFRTDGKTPVVEGLVAVGALDPTDPELAALRWVTDVLGGPRAGADPAPSVPQLWATMLAQERVFSPRAAMAGAVPVGAVAGPFDGVVVAIEGIDAQSEGFAIEVAVSPGARLNRRADGTALEWWAQVDTGDVVLGMLEDWAGPAEATKDKLYGRIEFHRPLDARARVLRVMPTTMTERAVVTITLPGART